MTGKSTLHIVKEALNEVHYKAKATKGCIYVIVIDYAKGFDSPRRKSFVRKLEMTLGETHPIVHMLKIL